MIVSVTVTIAQLTTQLVSAVLQELSPVSNHLTKDTLLQEAELL